MLEIDFGNSVSNVSTKFVLIHRSLFNFSLCSDKHCTYRHTCCNQRVYTGFSKLCIYNVAHSFISNVKFFCALEPAAAAGPWAGPPNRRATVTQARCRAGPRRRSTGRHKIVTLLIQFLQSSVPYSPAEPGPPGRCHLEPW